MAEAVEGPVDGGRAAAPAPTAACAAAAGGLAAAGPAAAAVAAVAVAVAPVPPRFTDAAAEDRGFGAGLGFVASAAII